MENPVSINSKRKKRNLSIIHWISWMAMPTPCWCVACTLLQDDDCGSGSGNVYNDTTITTTTKAAAKAMAGNNNSKQTQFKRRWNRLKFQYSLLYLISLHGYTPPNWIIEDWKRNIFRYTPFSTRIHILSLSYSLLVSSYVSLTPHIFLIRFWLCTGCFFHRSQDIYNSVYFNQLFLCTRSSKLPMCSLHVLNAANVWNFTFDVQILDNTIQFSSV